MKPVEYYRGREQTYIKHFFLERYLERVAYNVLSFMDEFVYVDGFSGPWKSEDENYDDTSFAIALNQLRAVKAGLKLRGKNVRIRCLFNDNKPDAYEALKKVASKITDIEIQLICSEFEEIIPEIVKYVGSSFSLTFIDPTGWTGFGLQKINPLLQLRGETIVNFMFDHVNRFLQDPQPKIAASLDPLFGGGGWLSEVEARIGAGESREDAVLYVYRARMEAHGRSKRVTSTRIQKPLSDRAYFHLVYVTSNWKGLLEFRNVEKKAVFEQERIRADAKLDSHAIRTGQTDIFASQGAQLGPRSFEAERRRNFKIGYDRLRRALSEYRSIKYESLLDHVLEVPLVWESDIKDWLRDMLKTGEIQIPALTGRARTPKPGHVIEWKGVTSGNDR